MAKYTNVLTIKHRGKGIPYGGYPHENGDINHGFKNLKTQPHLLGTIPELQADPALRTLVGTLNHPFSGFMSVGCTSGPVEDERGHRVSGYVEFAINSQTLIADAMPYFQIFFHFDKMLNDLKVDEDIHFYWELEGASFYEVKADGFTAAVTVNTGHHATREEAEACWAKGLGYLEHFLGNCEEA